MSLSVGIVGLPNTGKSTLFQAITQKQVSRENYPFCTIDPNLGVVAVPDERLDKLAAVLSRSQKIPTTIEFVDIAGLIAGASQGEGLGNKFLAHIRETDAIVYLLRGFQRKTVINTLDQIDPWSEKEILDTELILKDIETAEKRIVSLEKEIRAHQAEAIKERDILSGFIESLKGGQLLSENSLNSFEQEVVSKYQLLTAKPRIYLINANESEIKSTDLSNFPANSWIVLDVLIELEAAGLSDSEREELGLGKNKLNELIKSCYRLLDLITFFTTNEKEVRAWTLRQGQLAPEAGGAVHNDFEKNFIRAEVIGWGELVSCKTFAGARQRGLIRTEGRDYQVQDGDVIEIKAAP
jgi:ribosome-binding ATPase